MNLFAYGTLMFPEIWNRVVGRADQEFRRQPASVRGMAVYRAAGEDFPVLVAGHADDVARGLVLFDLPEDVVAALDEYESDFYERVEVTATLDDGAIVPAQAYVLPDEHRAAATDERWTAEWFREEAMADYIQKFKL